MITTTSKKQPMTLLHAMERIVEQSKDSKLGEELLTLFNDNQQVKFAQEMKRLDLDEEDMRLLTFFCHRLINHDDDDIRFSQMEDIFDGAAEYNAAKAKLRSAKHTLMKKKLIEHLCLRAALPLQGAVREAFCRGTGLHLARNDS